MSDLQDPLLRAMAALRAALIEVGEPHMLIGGTAVILRVTDGVDATVWAERVDVEQLLDILAQHEIAPRIPDAETFARQHQVLLLHAPTHTPMELSLAWLPFEREALQRAELLDVSGIEVPVALAEDLVIYKTVAWRDRDRSDVEPPGPTRTSTSGASAGSSPSSPPHSTNPSAWRISSASCRAFDHDADSAADVRSRIGALDCLSALPWRRAAAGSPPGSPSPRCSACGVPHRWRRGSSPPWLRAWAPGPVGRSRPARSGSASRSPSRCPGSGGSHGRSRPGRPAGRRARTLPCRRPRPRSATRRGTPTAGGSGCAASPAGRRCTRGRGACRRRTGRCRARPATRTTRGPSGATTCSVPWCAGSRTRSRSSCPCSRASPSGWRRAACRRPSAGSPTRSRGSRGRGAGRPDRAACRREIHRRRLPAPPAGGDDRRSSRRDRAACDASSVAFADGVLVAGTQPTINPFLGVIEVLGP